jgi:hypothetical protein
MLLTDHEGHPLLLVYYFILCNLQMHYFCSLRLPFATENIGYVLSSCWKLHPSYSYWLTAVVDFLLVL